jgi:glycosyltransferase involved in cell wall biosynthesis
MVMGRARMSVTKRMAVLLPLELTTKGPGYTCGLLARGMAGDGLALTIVTPRVRSFTVAPADVIEVLPQWTRYFPYRWVRPMGRRRIDAAFLNFAVDSASQVRAAYIFPDTAVRTIMDLKKAEIVVFREMINCHRGTAKSILDDAYRRLGSVPQHDISDASVVVEQQALEAVDYILCPSPMVEKSLQENGIASRKLLRASYGWDPARFSGSDLHLEPTEGLTAVFVGTIGVRKGVHLLLDYWARSGVKGRLVLAGAMEPLIKQKCADLLCRDDVVVLDYVKDAGALYRSADIFVFPTLEEGGPQVTYEACACGLPVITSSMGAGRIVRHGQEGFIIDAYDRDGWVSALRKLAKDTERRRVMARSAMERAPEFVWDAVAGRRRQQILDCLASRS